MFRTVQDVPNAGVLLALPALLAVGLLHQAHKYFRLPKGYYGLDSLLLLLAFMALARLESIESLRYSAPGEWGNLLGLERVPEVLRRRLERTVLPARQEAARREVERNRDAARGTRHHARFLERWWWPSWPRPELKERKGSLRTEISRAIAEAREHGDLRENAEYHAAREQQSFIEGRIRHLEYSISHAQIIDVAKLNPGEKVVFGATVTLADEESGEETTYQIVGDVEADIKHNLIAVSSPIARAIIGRELGDVVTVRAPGGEREYEIVDVEYI